MEKTAPKRKRFTGVVLSTKMKDTIVVSVSRYVRHPKYKKYMLLRKKYKVHDPGNTKQEGERVTIESCRPISKTKSFKIADITQNGRGQDAETSA